MADSSEELQRLRAFKFQRILSQDTGRKTLNLLGTVNDQCAILIAEKTFFNVSPPTLSAFTQTSTGLQDINILDRNDIYHWFLASLHQDATLNASVKITLIYPATETHIWKHSAQQARMIVETPEVHAKYVSKYVEQKIAGGRLQWVTNILTHEAESDRIVFEDPDPINGFIILPDLKWDRTTMTSMYLMALVHRTDIASIRSLDPSHLDFLKHIQSSILSAVPKQYTHVEADQLKIYIHYQPSYYHFHLHIVHISHDMGTSAAAGKAILLQTVIDTLQLMKEVGSTNGEVKGYKDINISYTLGEESELWQKVFGRLNAGEEPTV